MDHDPEMSFIWNSEAYLESCQIPKTEIFAKRVYG